MGTADLRGGHHIGLWIGDEVWWNVNFGALELSTPKLPVRE